MDFSALLSRYLERFRYGSRIDPSRDWLILLALAGIIFAAILAWNAWAFDTVAQGGVIGSPATSTPPIFDQSSLDAIHAVFKDRAAEDLKYVTGVYRYADPSQ